jgi:glycosyltransferase involved in cell wall biosynthesis
LKILLVGKGPPDRGGIAAFLRLLLASDLADAHEFEFLNVAHADAPEGGRWSTGNVRRTINDTSAVWRHAKTADIVHIHSALAPGVTLGRAGLLALAARMRRCGVIVHAHGGRVALWLTSAPRRWLARAALAPAHVVIAVSTGGRDALERTLPSGRVQLVDNGVDVNAFTPGATPHSPPRVLYAGTLTKRKGLLDLFEASELLNARGVAHELCVVGGTPDEGPPAEAEIRAAAPPSVQFWGQQPPETMPQVYARADVFCLPSWWEAMPLSVLEAMAAGLPVVASKVGDVPRLVDDGVTGCLVPAHDSAGLAEALERLCTEPLLAAKMGAAGRARAVDAFSLDACVRVLDRIYREVAPT